MYSHLGQESWRALKLSKLESFRVRKYSIGSKHFSALKLSILATGSTFTARLALNFKLIDSPDSFLSSSTILATSSLITVWRKIFQLQTPSMSSLQIFSALYRVSITKHNTSSGLLILSSLEESCKHLLKVGRSSTESITLNASFSMSKSLIQTKSWFPSLNHNGSIFIPPSHEGTLQIKSHREKTSNNWKILGPLGFSLWYSIMNLLNMMP